MILGRPSRTPRPAGFTFLEVLVVMAILGLLMGLGVGYLTNIQGAAGASQSLAILRETAVACKQSSNGETRAIFDLHKDPYAQDRLFVGAAVAESVLTHNFEQLDGVSRDYPLDVEGRVEIVPDGYTGSAGKFGRGGRLKFSPQSSFAMTEGLSLAVWVRPEASAGNRMTIIQGEGAYEIQLVKEQEAGAYDVLLKLNLRDADEGRTVAQPKEFKTKGAPVPADGRQWTHLRVVFDGTDASIRVGGFERYRARKLKATRTPSEEEGQAARRQTIAIPEGGVVELSISGSSHPFVGALDELVLGGVFRTADMNRELRGLQLLRSSVGVPVRVIFRNGRLDPDEHSSDVVLLFKEVGGKQGVPPIEMRFGLYGLVTQRMVTGAEGSSQ